MRPSSSFRPRPPTFCAGALTRRGARWRRSIFSTLYTLDSRFVLSGSDDANLRIWKARASDKLGVVDKREQVQREYRDGLREKWGTVADVAKIERCVVVLSLFALLDALLSCSPERARGGGLGQVCRQRLTRRRTPPPLHLPLARSPARSTRYLPKPIHQATKLKREMLDARRTKEENRLRHAPKGVDQELLKPKPARKAPIARVEQ